MKRRVAAALAGVAVVAATAVEFAGTGSVREAAEAALAGALAVATATLAGSLPGLSVRGLLIGGFFVGAGVLSWTHTERPIVVWSLLAVEGVVFAAWTYPWLRGLPALARLGGAWLGLAYWLIGIVGAVLAVQLRVAAERVAYAGLFTLAALAVVASVRRPPGGRDLSVGIVAAFLLAIAALVLAGSGNLFDAVHPVPDTPWGTGMAYRFWGGAYLLYHPNSLALIGVLVAVRIAPDAAFTRWQRLAALAVGGALIYVTNSRTGFLVAVTAAAVHAGLLWWRRRRPVPGLAEYATPARTWLAAAAPFLVLLAVLALSGGRGFLVQTRYGGGDVTSGRADTWRQVLVEWRDAGVVEKAFGDTRTARAVVMRESSGDDIKLTTDNAAVGALRRGGVLGVLAFLLGLALLIRHAVRGAPGRGRRRPPADPPGRRSAPAWFTVAVLATLPAIATADWLLGGTGGTLWILLLAGEAAVLFTPERAPVPAAAPP